MAFEEEEETLQEPEMFSEATKGKGKFPFFTSEIIENGAFPLSFQGENSHAILIFFAVGSGFSHSQRFRLNGPKIFLRWIKKTHFDLAIFMMIFEV